MEKRKAPIKRKLHKGTNTSTKSASRTKDGLNLQQEQFCQLYIDNDREMFGNGTQCYLEVYGDEYVKRNNKPMSYQVAMVNACNLLRNPKIVKRINNLLETGGFTEENVDKQHLFLINQHADFKAKMSAIKEFNALKGRIKNKLEITLPTPILANLNGVSSNNSNKEDNSAQ
jgi:hypothetical protein